MEKSLKHIFKTLIRLVIASHVMLLGKRLTIYMWSCLPNLAADSSGTQGSVIPHTTIYPNVLINGAFEK